MDYESGMWWLCDGDIKKFSGRFMINLFIISNLSVYHKNRRTTVMQRPSIIKSAFIFLENKNRPGETYAEKPPITFSSDSNEWCLS